MKCIFFTLLLFVIITCTPPVLFEQPYPLHEEDLLEIPPLYQGEFICESDSTFVIISEHNITLRTHYTFTTDIREISLIDDCEIIKDTLYFKNQNLFVPLTNLNDSLVTGVIEEIDTLFIIKKGSLARKYKGHLILNQEINTGQWALSLLSIDQDGNMRYRAITNDTDIKNVRKITKTREIKSEWDRSPKYIVKPTMIQFDKLFKDDQIFIECEYLVRVNLSEKLNSPLLN